MRNTTWVKFNGLNILLIEEDALAPQDELDCADVAIRVCRARRPNVDGSPIVSVVKNL
jgi:hypothetical protein